MIKIEFIIFGSPIAQGRPKFFRRGDFVGAYDPKKSKQAKKDFKVQALEHRPEKVIMKPTAIHLDLTFYLPRPQSIPKKIIYPFKKPDLSNIEKLVEDSMTGIFFEDDSQIISKNSIKKYCVNGDAPRIEVCVKEL